MMIMTTTMLKKKEIKIIEQVKCIFDMWYMFSRHLLLRMTVPGISHLYDRLFFSSPTHHLSVLFSLPPLQEVNSPVASTIYFTSNRSKRNWLCWKFCRGLRMSERVLILQQTTCSTVCSVISGNYVWKWVSTPKQEQSCKKTDFSMMSAKTFKTAETKKTWIRKTITPKLTTV